MSTSQRSCRHSDLAAIKTLPERLHRSVKDKLPIKCSLSMPTSACRWAETSFLPTHTPSNMALHQLATRQQKASLRILALAWSQQLSERCRRADPRCSFAHVNQVQRQGAVGACQLAGEATSILSPCYLSNSFGSSAFCHTGQRAR
eukprot:520994-Hanusia_phi.AAC.1